MDLLLRVKEDIRSRDYLEMMGELDEGFRRNIEQASPLLRPYLRHLCSALDAWCQALA